MIVRPWRRIAWLSPLFLVVFVFAGCAAPIGQLAPASRAEAQSGPTRSPQAGGESPSTDNRVRAAAIQAGLTLLRTGKPDTSLVPGESIVVAAGDRLAVPAGGQGILLFPGGVTVDLAGGTNVELGETQPSGGGGPAVALKQTAGTVHVEIKNAGGQVVLSTEQASVRSLGRDGEFLACQTPGGATCVVALRGRVRIESGGQQLDLEQGQGMMIAQGKLASPVCADMAMAARWSERSDAPQQAVSGRPPCGSLPAAAVAAATALPAGPAGTSSAPRAAATAGSAVAQAAPATPARPALPQNTGMVRIPEGTYTLGSPNEDPYHAATQSARLPAFWIDQYPATNAQYKAFLDQAGRRAPSSWANGTYPAGMEKFPAQGLAWDDAQAFCAAQKKRLPAEAEWEAAGRGAGANPPLYPWGDDPSAGGKTNTLPETTTYEVGSQSFNKSAAGVYDMLGSVWQWVDTPYKPVAGGTQVLRGGRHGLLLDLAYRLPSRPDDPRYTIYAGVRCAASRTAGE